MNRDERIEYAKQAFYGSDDTLYRQIAEAVLPADRESDGMDLQQVTDWMIAADDFQLSQLGLIPSAGVTSRFEVEPLVGKKVTVFSVNDFGFPNTAQVILTGCKIDGFAQYAQALYITWRKPRQRMDRANWILPGQTFVIWEGWHNVDTNHVDSSEQHEGYTMEHWSQPFDPRYLPQALASVPVPPTYMQSGK